MDKATQSILVWSIYLFILGATLIFAPNFLLSVFGLPAATDVWIRVAGMLVWILAYYCYSATVVLDINFYRWTVTARASVILFFIGFVLSGLAEPMLIGFGLVDLAGAAWTFVALKSSHDYRNQRVS